MQRNGNKTTSANFRTTISRVFSGGFCRQLCFSALSENLFSVFRLFRRRRRCRMTHAGSNGLRQTTSRCAKQKHHGLGLSTETDYLWDTRQQLRTTFCTMGFDSVLKNVLNYIIYIGNCSKCWRKSEFISF